MVNIVLILQLTSHLLLIVLGALIGKQKGRNIEVMNSFELLFDRVDTAIVVDREYYSTKEDQCKYTCIDISVRAPVLMSV